MEFQFPANPKVGDTVINPLTGTTYEFKAPGKWSIQSLTSSGDISVYEGPEPPPSASEYKLWFDTNSASLKYYYCDANNDCHWLTTAFNEEGVELLLSQLTAMSNVIIDLQTKVQTLESTFFLILE